MKYKNLLFRDKTFSLFSNTNWELLREKGIPPSILEKLIYRSKIGRIRDQRNALMKLNDIELSEEQKIVKNLVVTKNDNVFYTGAAGTGKSVLLQSIIGELRNKYGPDYVAVTATTGIAAINVGGQTLHSFAGLNPQSQLIDVERLISELPRKRNVVKRFIEIKALVIDEISMLKPDLFDKLDHIAQHFRRSKEPFGGLQLVVTGDFCQLPPIVKDYEKVNYCFEANSWNSLHHAIQLTEVHRQHEKEFVEMLNEFRFGNTSEKFNLIMKNLENTPAYENDGIDVTELFPRNQGVNMVNSVKLDAISNQEVTYEADDWESGDNGQLETLRRGCLAPQTLKLKINAQVMLIKNYTRSLVNGSKGVVICWFSAAKMSFYDEIPKDDSCFIFPVVKFINGETKIIPVADWTLNDESDEVTARRIQIPLTLSWAITIHKSQGQTLQRVKVDLNRVFEIGQTYVALSRAKSLKSLQVLNFSPGKVIAEKKVEEFYSKLDTKKSIKY